MTNWDKIKAAKNFVTGGGATVYIELINTPRLGEQLQVLVRAKVGHQALNASEVYLKVQSVEKIHLPGSSGVRVSTGSRSRSKRKWSASTRTGGNHRSVTWEHTKIIEPIDRLNADGFFEWNGEIRLPEDGLATYHGVHAKHIWQVRSGLKVIGNHPKSSWLEFSINR